MKETSVLSNRPSPCSDESTAVQTTFGRHFIDKYRKGTAAQFVAPLEESVAGEFSWCSRMRHDVTVRVAAGLRQPEAATADLAFGI
jgi:hypothetical protein